MKKHNQQRRIFSRFFKKEKVDLLDQGKISVKELSKIYQVSATAIYKWRKKYSKYTSTERIIGKKQMEIDYYKTTLE